MAVIKATVAYDGTAYQGWQRQTNGLGIQQVMENALQSIHKRETPVTASGRTDAGVHAKGQVFHFEGRPDINYKLALNSILPPDIRIKETKVEKEGFHARFSARKKRYDYFLCTDTTDPFSRNTSWQLRWDIDPQKMEAAARHFLGTHDFTSFCNAKVEQEKDKVRTIERIDIYKEEDGYRLTFVGDGFLRYQVRMMTGAIVAAGTGKISPEDIPSMLAVKDKHANRFCAPAQGLFLMEVFYE